MLQKKIVFYIDTFLAGGVETSLLEYLNNLDHTKYNVHLIIGYRLYDFEILKPQISSHITLHYIIQHRFLCAPLITKQIKKPSILEKLIDNLFISPIRSVLFRHKILKLLPQFEAIVDYALCLTKIIAHKKIVQQHKVAFFHFSLKEYYVKDQRKFIYLQKALLSYATLVIINKSMLIEAKECFPQLMNKFVLMYNQINFNHIRKLAAQNDKEISQQTNNSEYIVSVGRLAENQKDFTTLIKAFYLVKTHYHHHEKLIIIGTGKDLSHLQQLVNQLNLSTEVKLIGHKINPFPWIIKSKLFAFCSKFEGLAMVLIEAMILSIPIVSSDCPNGPREVLNNGECGLLVPIGNPEKTAAAIHQLLSNKKLCQELTHKATSSLIRFDITQNIFRLEQILNKNIK